MEGKGVTKNSLTYMYIMYIIYVHIMVSWNMAQTRSSLKKVLQAAKQEPQVLKNRGEPIAVILDFEEYTQLKKKAEKPLASLWKKLDEIVERSGYDLTLPKPKKISPKNPFMVNQR